MVLAPLQGEESLPHSGQRSSRLSPGSTNNRSLSFPLSLDRKDSIHTQFYFTIILFVVTHQSSTSCITCVLIFRIHWFPICAWNKFSSTISNLLIIILSYDWIPLQSIHILAQYEHWTHIWNVLKNEFWHIIVNFLDVLGINDRHITIGQLHQNISVVIITLTTQDCLLLNRKRTTLHYFTVIGFVFSTFHTYFQFFNGLHQRVTLLLQNGTVAQSCCLNLLEFPDSRFNSL